MWQVASLLLALSAISCVRADCGYASCPKGTPGMINVHLVPHTHDDMGWLKTVDQYYYGANTTIAVGGVQYTITTMIQSLQRNPARKFTYVEIGYFTRWWQEQDDMTRHLVQGLVANGQLHFANGGWTANDEANSHYAAIIDQMSLGLVTLNRTFGQCGNPSVGWSIDAFGHSSGMAQLYSQMGMDAYFFGRIHENDRALRWKQKTMEVVWQTDTQDLGPAGDIFAGVFYTGYGPPAGFCFDEFCNDQPIMDDDRMEDYNVDERVAAFLEAAYDYARVYQTNHVMMTMGSDFQYMNSERWYMNLEKLMKYVNAGSAAGKHNVTTFYSQPQCYLKSLNDAGLSWPTKSDDFFPYASGNHSYWTGYFTSKPTLKGYIRKLNSALQLCRQVDANFGLGPYDESDLEVIKRAVALTQHHDAVTGTAKAHVVKDYDKHLYKALKECEHVINDAFAKATKQADVLDPNPAAWQTICPFLNISICNVSQNEDSFTVTVFNALSRSAREIVRVPVPSTDFIVKDGSTEIVADAVKVGNSSANILNKSAPYEIVFRTNVPAMGYRSYTIVKKSGTRLKTMQAKHHHKTSHRAHHFGAGKVATAGPFTVANQKISLNFDGYGRLSKIISLEQSVSTDVSQDFLYYHSATNESQPSGAYIFRPNGTMAEHVDPGDIEVEVIKGKLVQEIRQTYSDWVSQVIRLYDNESAIEFEWTVGPIPIQKGSLVGKEVITRFKSDIENNDLFYTDANGRMMMERKLDYQAEYPYLNSEPVAGNYYPVNTRIAIKDSNRQLTVVTDRAEGGASLNPGQIELMVHRRCLLDDHFGVGEPLNETGPDGRGLVARGKHWVLLSEPSHAAEDHRLTAQRAFYSPLATFATAPTLAPTSDVLSKFSGLTRDLPSNVNILTLEQGLGSTMLLRLEHIFQSGEGPLSSPATVDLTGLFTNFDVVSAEELALGGDRALSSVHKMTWTTKDGKTSPLEPNVAVGHVDLTAIQLKPLEIRTFQLVIHRK